MSILNDFEKNIDSTIKILKSHATSTIDATRSAADEHFGIKEENKSLEDIASTIAVHLEAGRYKEAGKFLGHQVFLGARSLSEDMQNTAFKVCAFMGELTNESQKNIADIFKDLAGKCEKFDNNFMKAVGAVCKGIATFIENPGKALENISKIVKENITKICEAAKGKASDKAMAR